MNDESPWATDEKDQRQAERSSRIKTRDMLEAAEKRSVGKAVLIVAAVVVGTFGVFLAVLYAIVKVVSAAWGH